MLTFLPDTLCILRVYFVCACTIMSVQSYLFICADIDECLEGKHTCVPTYSRCVNTEGGFGCQCFPGYIQVGDRDCRRKDHAHTCCLYAVWLSCVRVRMSS